MKFLIDIYLSPAWIEIFEQHGLQVVHWSSVGGPRAEDRLIMEWARLNGYILFTHDLDFGTLLALTHIEGPGVIQVRTQDVMPQSLGKRLMEIFKQYESEIKKGALITVDEAKSRVRILPLP